MTIASGVNKLVRFAREAIWGVAATGQAKPFRRTSSTLDVEKDSFESAEIATSRQVRDARHGMRKATGALEGELAPGNFPDMFAAVLRRDFGGGASAVAANGLVMSLTGFVADALSMLASRFSAGTVIRLSGIVGAGSELNGVNLLITKLAAGIGGKCYCQRLDGLPLPVGNVAGPVTIEEVGARTFAPRSGHQAISFTLEHYFEDLGTAELFTGCKVNKADVSLPPTGMAKAKFDMLGKDGQDLPGAYFEDVAEAPAGRALSGANGVVFAIGRNQTVVTSLDIAIDAGLSSEPVVGSKVAPAVFDGRIKVTGSLKALFDGPQFREAFLKEQEISLVAVFLEDETPGSEFVALAMPRVKLNAAKKDDSEKGLVQDIPFQALEGYGTDGFEPTSLLLQDSRVVVA